MIYVYAAPKMIPIAIKENIVTERTTDGASPASIPNKISDVSIINSFIHEPFLLGIGFKTNVIKHWHETHMKS
jgi:hypothetical protein